VTACAICRDPITAGSESVLPNELARRICFRRGQLRVHRACQVAAERVLEDEHSAIMLEPRRVHGILDLEVTVF
jgi:hypothetical protein